MGEAAMTGFTGREGNMEGRIEVREGARKGEDLREWKWSKETMGGLGREGEVREEEGGA